MTNYAFKSTGLTLKSTSLASVMILALGGSLSVQAEELQALDCVINPHKVFDLGSGVPGVINRVTVDRSDFVEANQVIAELESGVERANVAVAKARAGMSSEVHLGELNLAFDQRRKTRISELYEVKSVSIQNKEDAELEAELSRGRLQEAQEREYIRQLELARAQEQLEQKIVRSPGSGFVLKKFRSEGEYIEDQPIVRIAQLDQLNVEVIAPMELFGKIKVGMHADVYPETLENNSRRAEVSVVDRMGDTASGTFGVRLTLPNQDYAIPAGLKCTLQFALEDSDNQRKTDPRQVATLPDMDAGSTAAPANSVVDEPLQSLWASVKPQSPSVGSSLSTLMQYITPGTQAVAGR